MKTTKSLAEMAGIKPEDLVSPAIELMQMAAQRTSLAADIFAQFAKTAATGASSGLHFWEEMAKLANLGWKHTDAFPLSLVAAFEYNRNKIAALLPYMNDNEGPTWGRLKAYAKLQLGMEWEDFLDLSPKQFLDHVECKEHFRRSQAGGTENPAEPGKSQPTKRKPGRPQGVPVKVNLLKELRENCEFSQGALADEAGINLSSIQRAEEGRISKSVLKKIADALTLNGQRVSVDDLIAV